MLILSSVDASRLHVERLVAPLRMASRQLSGDAIVLAIEERLHAHEAEVLRCAKLAAEKALGRAVHRQRARLVRQRQVGATRDARAIGWRARTSGQHAWNDKIKQNILHANCDIILQKVQHTAFKGPQGRSSIGVHAVYLASVQKWRQQVQLLSVS